jgi:hypothetical protein
MLALPIEINIFFRNLKRRLVFKYGKQWLSICTYILPVLCSPACLSPALPCSLFFNKHLTEGHRQSQTATVQTLAPVAATINKACCGGGGWWGLKHDLGERRGTKVQESPDFLAPAAWVSGVIDGVMFSSWRIVIYIRTAGSPSLHYILKTCNI